jgi:hypothetical protein
MGEEHDAVPGRLELTGFGWGPTGSAAPGIWVVGGATKDRTCVVFALVWVTKVVVVVVAVDTVVLLVWPRVIVASEKLEFILPVRHQRGRHFAGQICLQ